MLSQYITHLILLSLCSHFPTDTSLRIGLIVICYHLSLATYDAAGNLTLPVQRGELYRLFRELKCTHLACLAASDTLRYGAAEQGRHSFGQWALIG